jgi:hypothetical protein
MFEALLGKGPLTLIFVKKETCGPCHRFNDEVWQPLTKLKNKSVNLATVDSEVFRNTSLANTPPKFYPTLMLVGKDKKPATFEDEEGMPTNAMPRNSTLSEDKEALSNLVINPTVKASMNNTVNPSLRRTIQSPLNPTVNTSMNSSINSSMNPSINSSMNLVASANSPRRAIVTRKSLAKSPFQALNTITNGDSPPKNLEESNEDSELNNLDSSTMNDSQPASRTVTTMKLKSNSKEMGNSSSRQISSSSPPNIAADLVSSQTKSPTPSASPIPVPVRGGTMLRAIKQRTAEIQSMLKLRSSTRKHK